MSKKLFYLVCFVLVLSVAGNVSADLVLHWPLDGDATDLSGNGYDGTVGGTANWVAGQIGLALDFDGSSTYIDLDDRIVEGTFTLALWLKPRDIPYSSGYYAVMHTDAWSAGSFHVHLRNSTSLFNGDVNNGPGVTSTTVLQENEWYHCVITVTNVGGNASQMYINGVLEDEGSGGSGVAYLGDLNFGAWHNGSERYYHGLMDDIRVYDHVLTQEEIEQAMKGIPPGSASNFSPADEATDVPREVTLSWTPGEFAATTNGHKVYFGESFNDVNDATGGVAQDANSYTPAQRLDFGTTYYWRIDEVNAPPTSQIEFKGEVWSFTTEPFSYPVENVTATASSTHQADTGPENTINGLGLDANDLHSIEPADMWLSSDEPNGAWIEYEFDKVCKLHEMWVWSHNGMMESVLGFGPKDVTIEYSTNGTDYTTLGTTHEFARAPGAVDYAHNTTVDFGGATAKYVRLTTNSNWGNILDQYGLSEVRFFSIPVFAREPSPDSGTTDVAVDVTLGFRAGREAVTHDVYLSSDEQAVIDGNVPVTTVTETNYGPLSLDLGTTYYWKINEVNE
ncbi:MAG: discoidin domain-containing protein, partial [Planctomycetes bacterium]|nr:discoidin domain-containing protein [Planctomycetota bacterium]